MFFLKGIREKGKDVVVVYFFIWFENLFLWVLIRGYVLD